MYGDEFMLALCLWREARGEPQEGIVAVACVIRNRVALYHSSYYQEIVKPWQFSSITANGDPQLKRWPAVDDPAWEECQSIAHKAISTPMADITQGAVNYYADTIAPPHWVNDMTFTIQIGHHRFYKA